MSNQAENGGLPKLNSSESWFDWIAALQSHAYAINAWDLIDPDKEAVASDSSTAPTPPQADEIYRTELYRVLKLDKPSAEDRTNLELLKSIAEWDWRTYKVTLEAHNEHETKLMKIQALILSSVDPYLLIRARNELEKEQRNELEKEHTPRQLIKKLKSIVCPRSRDVAGWL